VIKRREAKWVCANLSGDGRGADSPFSGIRETWNSQRKKWKGGAMSRGEEVEAIRIIVQDLSSKGKAHLLGVNGQKAEQEWARKVSSDLRIGHPLAEKRRTETRVT